MTMTIQVSLVTAPTSPATLWTIVYENRYVTYPLSSLLHMLFIAFEFIFILKQIFCLPEKPQ